MVNNVYENNELSNSNRYRYSTEHLRTEWAQTSPNFIIHTNIEDVLRIWGQSDIFFDWISGQLVENSGQNRLISIHSNLNHNRSHVHWK